ncbi:Uncharacterised protein [Mycobacterium tuberculosis]|nr:Uncharacterised protein [Mycobacterium tuberculosis]
MDTTKPNRKRAPRPAPSQCSPSAMHTPSPPSRTGTPGTAAATRSRSGKPPQDPMLIGLTRPLCRSIGPAEAIPTPPTAPPATPSASAIISATAAQTCSAPPYAGVGRWAVCTNVPAGSARPAAILVPPMSRQRVSISAGGCCRVGAGRRGAHSRGPAPPGRSGARPATPGRRGGARPPTDAR